MEKLLLLQNETELSSVSDQGDESSINEKKQISTAKESYETKEFYIDEILIRNVLSKLEDKKDTAKLETIENELRISKFKSHTVSSLISQTNNLLNKDDYKNLLEVEKLDRFGKLSLNCEGNKARHIEEFEVLFDELKQANAYSID